MLALSISVPSKGTTINAAIADHVPVAELIPHLVEPQPGEHWVLHRAIGQVRPEHTLAQAGVQPGELLTLAVAQAPAPPQEAVEELTGPVGPNPATWVAALIVALFSVASAAVFAARTSGIGWRPIDVPQVLPWHSPTHPLMSSAVLGITALAALACAAASLHIRNFHLLAAVLGFGAGLHINVLCAAVCAALLVWRSGPVRIWCVVVAVFAALNVWPGFTLALALVALAYSGQMAIGIAGIRLPKVPATGVFHPPTATRAGAVVAVHSAIVVALCCVILACVVQIAPWGAPLDGWTCALLIVLAVMGLSARSTRPVHAVAVASTSALILLWLALHVPWGVAVLVLVGLPAVRISSPTVGRVVDWIEALAFCAAIPLALEQTSVFDAIRGIGS
ncbi:membrane protein [Corynebacterium falsenii DSM 44353]|uniref:EsaB/YukD family protein n=1 Tax=Corynebacterium falsenii TaxID=108486 RepID=UPI0003E96F40|nr:EsaB/YukD family protein [Corynebacterium falsenii]AHI03847.1 membrane protein [Corynebacterium falsenii DSM 44353]UBI04620.1 EsaB/YukD family protein [Corynebacterium falsenii]